MTLNDDDPTELIADIQSALSLPPISNSLTNKSLLAAQQKSSNIGHVRVLNLDEIDSLLGFGDYRKEEEERELRESFPPVRDAWESYQTLVDLHERFIDAVTSDDYIVKTWPEIKQLREMIKSRREDYDVILKLSRE